ncbi:hypothetical protein [Nocardioides gilvus]|uniref:hypothetical protein n=1 Tax=Nocardioides gilvus TaxID=1735589 RepID=UPI0013A595AD|nr:hypothetical protein [Nocardioides gilvus]
MRPTLLLAGLTVLTIPLLTSCAGPDRSADADDLRGALADLPGVAEVDFGYTEPEFLDSGKVALTVRMDEEARAGAVPAVVTTAYEAFSGTHHDEEGDVFVNFDDDVVHLRSFQPSAEVDHVADVVTRALAVLPAGAVQVDIDTQEPDQEPYVFTSFTVTIAQEDADSVLQTMTGLEQVHGAIPDAGWRVLTSGEGIWEFGSTAGFPGADQRAIFAELRGDLPPKASIQLVDDFVTVQVPEQTTTDQVATMVDRHLGLLGGVEDAFYDVTSGENFYAMFSAGECTFAEGEVGARLKEDHGDDCATVSGEGEEPS